MTRRIIAAYWDRVDHIRNAVGNLLWPPRIITDNGDNTFSFVQSNVQEVTNWARERMSQNNLVRTSLSALGSYKAFYMDTQYTIQSISGSVTTPFGDRHYLWADAFSIYNLHDDGQCMEVASGNHFTGLGVDLKRDIVQQTNNQAFVMNQLKLSEYVPDVVSASLRDLDPLHRDFRKNRDMDLVIPIVIAAVSAKHWGEIATSLEEIWNVYEKYRQNPLDFRFERALVEAPASDTYSTS